jgi:hypothetical protein
MSAGITSDPSQPERPRGGAKLYSGGGKVDIILEEANGLAGICQDSWSPVVLALTEKAKGGKLAYSKNQNSPMLARKLDLPCKLNQE